MKKTAVALFEGKAKGESKKGVKMDLDNFNATLIFKKKDDQWKMAYTHDSAEQEIKMPESYSTQT